MSFAALSSEPYDAIIVGSGATGGVAAKALAEAGWKILVLEAGRSVNPQQDLCHPARDMVMRVNNLALARRQSFQALHPGYWKANPDFFVNEKDNPYTTPPDKPFYWIRGRQLGGRSLTWGGITLRFSNYEFKAASQDGVGDNWPIAYEDLEPYYDALEGYFQIHGERNGLPQLPDGNFLSAMPLTPAEEKLKQEVACHWPQRHVIPSRGFKLHTATLTDPWSRSASVGSTLKAAVETGRTTVVTDAVVSHVVFIPRSRLAKGVAFIHREHKTTHEVYGHHVILCASTLESVRILLHSTEQFQPGGLKNSSGLLGRYLMDHVSTIQFFTLPNIDPPTTPFELSGCESIFIPRYCNLDRPQEKFLRGFGLWGGIQRLNVPRLLEKGGGATGFFVGHGEVLPHADNRILLNTDVKDAWGIPVPHIEFSWTENEKQIIARIRQDIQEMVSIMEGVCLPLADLYHLPLFEKFIRRQEAAMSAGAPPGYYVHEVGGAKMGTSPEHSILNSENQCWECPNLLVTDGSCWVSSGWQNPTLTEMAITARACHQLLQRARQSSSA
jgi:choline dehydrogenase-like flavoprotein